MADAQPLTHLTAGRRLTERLRQVEPGGDDPNQLVLTVVCGGAKRA